MEFGMEVTPGQVDERIAFGSMAKGQKRYGSTSTRFKRDETQGFSYTVQRGDTLQGLAVKFGISTEQIRRTNQLWTNDSLFLRDKLIIPIHVENGNTGDGQSSNSSTIASPNSSTSDRRPQSSSTNGSTSVKSHSSLSGNQVLSSNGIPPENSNFQSPESMSTGSKHWTHPLSDSFEFDDGLTSPDSIKLDSDSLSSPNCVPSGSPFEKNSNHNRSGIENEKSGFTNGCSLKQTGDETVEGVSLPPRRYMVKDHSEKSANEFLSRIDIAIASTRERTLPLNQNTKHWVTFESDSESEQQIPRTGGTALLVDDHQLRYSLRKLEKKEEELFQL